MVFATLAFLCAFGADQGLLTYFADLSGPDCEPPELSETRWFEGMLGQADLKHLLISAVFRYFPDNVRAILGIV